jgi:hypothetical protein
MSRAAVHPMIRMLGLDLLDLSDSHAENMGIGGQARICTLHNSVSYDHVSMGTTLWGTFSNSLGP